MKQETIRMSPKFISTMMVFKEYLPKEKLSPTRNPNLIKIYGKQNIERELIIGAANKASFVKLPRKKDDDERFLRQIDLDFQKQIVTKTKIKSFNSDQLSEIRESIHQEVIHSDREQFQSIIRKNFSTHLTSEHYQLMKTFHQESPFYEKVKLREPVEMAKSILNETVQRHEIYQQQLRHDRQFLESPINRFPQLDFSKLGKSKLTIIENTKRSNSTKECVKAIDNNCLTERQGCRKILKQFKRAQGRFSNKFQGIQDECQIILH